MAEAAKQPMSVAGAARAALVDMAKENVPPTPENYQRYFGKYAAVPAPEKLPTLRDLHNWLHSFTHNGVQHWTAAVKMVIEKNDWGSLETMIHNSLKPSPPVAAAEPIPAPSPDRELTNQIQGLNSVLYVMESFARNLATLMPNDPVVSGQIEIVRDLLENPGDREKLFSAKRALTKAMSSTAAQEQLQAAKDQAKNMADAFLAGMGQAGAEAGAFCEVIEQHRKAVEAASSQEELAQATQALLSSADQSRSRMQESQATMEATHAEAQSANDRIKNLEDSIRREAEKAKQDYLSGLMDRRSMNDELDKVFNSAINKITIALLDIDNFNKINETQGAGDVALNLLAESIEECVSGKGVPSRMGNEEFLILFSGYGADQVKEEMERLQRTLTKKFFLENDSRTVITFSAGIAQRLEGEAPSEAIMRADDAMHHAKSKGKNRVEIAWGD